MKVFYTDHFVLPLPDGHRFPMQKYSLLREAVQSFAPHALEEAPAATDEQLFNRLFPPDKKGRRKFGRGMAGRLKKLGIHKENPEDLTPAERSRLVRLDIDPETITWRRVVS